MISIKPKISFYEVEYHLDRFQEKLIEKNRIYRLIKKLIKQAFPSYENKFDKRWENFYLPSERESKLIAIPFQVMEYKNEFFLNFHLLGNLHVKKGNKKVEEIYEKIFKETLRFIPLIQENEKILNQVVPYDLRTGKVKGKYVLEKLLFKREKERTLKNYKKHLERGLKIKEISLYQYLKVAEICYKSAFGKKAKNLTSYEMYKKWADGRDGGMLSIKDEKSKREFMEWCRSGKWTGSHPFEIIFSWHSHGIHLYPPLSLLLPNGYQLFLQLEIS